MSSINSVGGNSPVQKITTNPIKKEISAQAPQSSNTTDKVELSGMSHLLKALKTNDVRTDKVADIRAQIEAGTYETDDKLDGVNIIPFVTGEKKGAPHDTLYWRWGSQAASPVSFEVGLHGQARELRSAYRYLIANRHRLNLRQVDWFTWKDMTGACSFCDSSGLFRRGAAFRPKPAWHAFVSFAR